MITMTDSPYMLNLHVENFGDDQIVCNPSDPLRYRTKDNIFFDIDLSRVMSSGISRNKENERREKKLHALLKEKGEVTMPFSMHNVNKNKISGLITLDLMDSIYISVDIKNTGLIERLLNKEIHEFIYLVSNEQIELHMENITRDN